MGTTVRSAFCEYEAARATLINAMVCHEAEAETNLAAARELVLRLAAHVARLRAACAACAEQSADRHRRPGGTMLLELYDEHSHVVDVAVGIATALESLSAAGRRRRDDLETKIAELRGSAYRLSACLSDPGRDV
ncbi:hypothetical protein [Cryptosporangium sp. NPDC048952]|uniref:hypothetical protein n=1 Tax=Cryptosporangium sp. NPDC048952 TaxID=3363961 RepID=UPI003720C6DF